MAARIKTFQRYELKYLLPREQVRALAQDLALYLRPDPYSLEAGSYQITSLYYDTADYQAYWNKLEGHRFRRKVRIRVYGDQLVTPETRVQIEVKERHNKVMAKRRVTASYQAARQLCGAGEVIETDSAIEAATVREIQYMVAVQHLQPACIVSYRRRALEGGEYDPGLRVTIDTNLKGRTHHLTLLSDSPADNHYVLPPNWAIMEIKVNIRVPYWLAELVGRYGCTLRRISKYCTTLEASKTMLHRQYLEV
jgi:SPX domain protein involved in polyphosphate accumulation